MARGKYAASVSAMYTTQRAGYHHSEQLLTFSSLCNIFILTMPHIILKKTFKVKPSGFSVATEKSFSFHGAVPQSLIDAINRRWSTSLSFTPGANTPQFRLDGYGHYFAEMNHDCQKHHEEDLIALMLDVMEKLKWTMKFQYDTESSSVKATGSSETSRELFIFHKAAAV